MAPRFLSMTCLGLLFHLASLGGATAQGTVWIVDSTAPPDADFAAIQPAIDAAAEGDTVLIRTGIYPGLLIDGKSLTVTAEEGAVVLIRNATGPTDMIVRNLALGQQVLLSGLVSVPPVINGVDPDIPGMLLENNLGAVWVENSIIVAHLATSGGTQYECDGVRILNCFSVVFSRCEIYGQSPFLPPGSVAAGLGIDSVASTVSLYDSIVVGGEFGESTVDETPAHGMVLNGGLLFASNSRFRGADGPDQGPFPGPCVEGKPGADGLVVEGSSPVAYAIDPEFFPGQGGAVTSDDFPFCAPGLAGSPVTAAPGDYILFPGRSYPFRALSPVRGGQDTVLTFEADPGDFLFMGASIDTGSIFFPPFLGVLQLGVPDPALFIGIMDPLGVIDIPVTLALLGPGIDSVRLNLQSLIFTTTAQFVLGSPSSLVILNEAL